MMYMKKILAILLVISTAALSACTFSFTDNSANQNSKESPAILNSIPEYSGKAYVELDGNNPSFTDKEKLNVKSFETYSKLDSLGRCGVAYANISTDILPSKKRESISSVKPTGWVQHEYAFVEDGHLYNRCHLIAHMLTGEDANERNLITGTRYMNTEGMLPFEKKVHNYILTTKNHVLYRVTPIFDGKNLVADGVRMEAWSVEDNGRGICYNVFCYNVQPGVMITYANGNSKADGTIKVYGKSNTSGNKKSTITYNKKSSDAKTSAKYILNTKRMKFHKPDCASVNSMGENNKKTYNGSRSELIKEGYSPCGSCKP